MIPVKQGKRTFLQRGDVEAVKVGWLQGLAPYVLLLLQAGWGVLELVTAFIGQGFNLPSKA